MTEPEYAFPHTEIIKNAIGSITGEMNCHGMTIRQVYALGSLTGRRSNIGKGPCSNNVASLCFRDADAMIEFERENKE